MSEEKKRLESQKGGAHLAKPGSKKERNGGTDRTNRAAPRRMETDGRPQQSGNVRFTDMDRRTTIRAGKTVSASRGSSGIKYPSSDYAYYVNNAAA